MTRARCGSGSGLPSSSIASWNPPRTWSAPSFHHSGNASSNSQRRSAAASLTTSRIGPLPIDVAFGNNCPGVRQSSFAGARAQGAVDAAGPCFRRLLLQEAFVTASFWHFSSLILHRTVSTESKQRRGDQGGGSVTVRRKGRHLVGGA